MTGTLGHALLGVLAEGPRTGYAFDLAFRAAVPGSLDPGLIRERGAAPRGGRVYEITEAGLEEVRRWLRETEPSRTVRNEAALRLFFLWLLEPEEAEAYLRGEAEQAHATLEQLERIAEQEDPDNPKTRAYRTALELGLHTARARLAWAEQALTAAGHRSR